MTYQEATVARDEARRELAIARGALEAAQWDVQRLERARDAAESALATASKTWVLMGEPEEYQGPHNGDAHLVVTKIEHGPDGTTMTLDAAAEAPRHQPAKRRGHK